MCFLGLLVETTDAVTQKWCFAFELQSKVVITSDGKQVYL